MNIGELERCLEIDRSVVECCICKFVMFGTRVPVCMAHGFDVWLQEYRHMQKVKHDAEVAVMVAKMLKEQVIP